jgi:hypothetical protein
MAIGELIVLTHEEAERVADDECLSWVKEVEAPSRTFDLEKLVGLSGRNRCASAWDGKPRQRAP